MSSPDPFRAVTRPRAGTRLEPDGTVTVAGTVYRTRAGHIVGLDWDALRDNGPEAEGDA